MRISLLDVQPSMHLYADPHQNIDADPQNIKDNKVHLMMVLAILRLIMKKKLLKKCIF